MTDGPCEMSTQRQCLSAIWQSSVQRKKEDQMLHTNGQQRQQLHSRNHTVKRRHCCLGRVENLPKSRRRHCTLKSGVIQCSKLLISSNEEVKWQLGGLLKLTCYGRQCRKWLQSRPMRTVCQGGQASQPRPPAVGNKAQSTQRPASLDMRRCRCCGHLKGPRGPRQHSRGDRLLAQSRLSMTGRGKDI